uniref:Uncharacterized protein n=1 Tax=Odontella aurita TaxID=265563 RepID=A0A7S4JTK6_9STRA|mmetsp:Transcript_53915/g.161344  ORF Transcript_53915/g.161344 Transcript_53915/m.161344 type:complete len:418 (+) Transcript_53915:501-1754(+)
MIKAPRYHRCCTTVQSEYFVAAIASVLLLATVGSPAPRSLALIILLSLIIAASLLAAIIDWRADATLQASLLEKSTTSMPDYGDVRSRSSRDTEDVEKQDESPYLKMKDTSLVKRPKPEETEDFINEVDVGLRPRRHVVVILFSSGISLFLLLMVRLIAGALHFRGYPPLLDFGPKYGNPSEDAEGNIAFENELNSYGHCIQGVLSSLLSFPAVAGALARVAVCGEANKGIIHSVPRVPIIGLVEALAAIMSCYPTYNFIKRAVFHAGTFATSSFMNNGLEWAIGCILGLSLGMLASAGIRKKIVSGYLLNPKRTRKNLIFREGHDRSLVYGKYDEYPVGECFVWIIFAFQMMIGFFLTFSVYGCAILTGHTWNRCENNSNECLNFDADLAPAFIRYGLVALPALIFFISVMVTHGY